MRKPRKGQHISQNAPGCIMVTNTPQCGTACSNFYLMLPVREGRRLRGLCRSLKLPLITHCPDKVCWPCPTQGSWTCNPSSNLQKSRGGKYSENNMMTRGQFTLRVTKHSAPSPSVQPQIPLWHTSPAGTISTVSGWHVGVSSSAMRCYNSCITHRWGIS